MIKYNKDVMRIASKQAASRDVLLLCSSGVDSIAMTHYMLTKHRRSFDNMRVLHFNHKIRAENDLMQQSFERFMRECFPKVSSHTICNSDETLKTEDDFRRFRTSWLVNFPSTIVVSAHHLNDYVESYLLNTIRGNPEYLPMPFVCAHASGYTTCKPFCFTRKRDFVEYATHHCLMQYVVEDSTNTRTQGSRRNLIRNEIIPILEREHVGLETIVSKRMHVRLLQQAV